MGIDGIGPFTVLSMSATKTGKTPKITSTAPGVSQTLAAREQFSTFPVGINLNGVFANDANFVNAVLSGQATGITDFPTPIQSFIVSAASEVANIMNSDLAVGASGDSSLGKTLLATGSSAAAASAATTIASSTMGTMAPTAASSNTMSMMMSSTAVTSNGAVPTAQAAKLGLLAGVAMAMAL